MKASVRRVFASAPPPPRSAALPDPFYSFGVMNKLRRSSHLGMGSISLPAPFPFGKEASCALPEPFYWQQKPKPKPEPATASCPLDDPFYWHQNKVLQLVGKYFH
jgi:hypothetical protein